MDGMASVLGCIERWRRGARSDGHGRGRGHARVTPDV